MEPWNEVYKFWFGDFLETGKVPESKQKMWFSKSDQTDETIRTQFRDQMEQAARGKLTGWQSHPRAQLCLILLLDQFPRNVYRGQPDSFAQDAKALVLAKHITSSPAHTKLQSIERVFAYLPFEHSEEARDQTRSVELFTELVQEVSASEKIEFQGYLDYALKHQVIIERFGRFPHRNAILGRPSTVAEVEFLKEPGSGF